jgi:hypothetical protein
MKVAHRDIARHVIDNKMDDIAYSRQFYGP